MKYVLVAVLGLGLTPAAHAQQGGFRFEEQVVKGKIQKPEIQIYITKQNLSPKYQLELKESFLPKIEAAIKAKPF